MSELLELQRIGLISKICGELDHHLGFSDKTLAEFIIHLAETNSDVNIFHKTLAENGADFPIAFTNNLHKIIQMSKISENSMNQAKGSLMPTVPRNQTEIQFPALSRPNSGPVELEKLSNSEESWIKSLKQDDTNKSSNNSSKKRERSPPNDNNRSSGNSNKVKNSNLELYEIYDGKISNILDFGCFVEIEGFFRKEGLVHIAQIQQGMVKDARQVVKRGQKVKVKVISMTGTKIGLSMKEVDQVTGKDLLPERAQQHKTASNEYSNPTRPTNEGKMDLGIDINKFRQKELQEGEGGGNRKKKLSSPEMWEIKQLIQSGVLPVTEYPTFDSESGLGVLQTQEMEEDVEVELNETEPPFLKGQARNSRELSPPRIVINPDGSLQRAALHQSQLSKERRELKQAQTNNLIDSIPKDLSKPWEDPMPEQGERHFAQELKSINVGGSFELPEWKQKSQGKGLSYGQITSKTIKEQRESLPIYRLKSQLCTAIAQNQVLVVIGETGSGKTLLLH